MHMWEKESNESQGLEEVEGTERGYISKEA
jgi:hypothetical protein